MRTLVCYSVSEAEAVRFDANGPRRDIRLLIEHSNAEVLYRRASSSRKGVLAKFLGPHIRHAWQAAGQAHNFDVIFADGEHVGLPLLFFLAFRGSRKTRVVMLCHLIDKNWKRWLLRMGTRLTPVGTLLFHSVQQAHVGSALAAGGWTVRVVPYQVDTEFWRAPPVPGDGRIRPFVVAVGSESRDYGTLAKAIAELDIDVCIAAGSHWARKTAPFAGRPLNAEYIREALPFADLRDLYQRADIVVVPLHAVNNQSGVTTILEAMSMGRPVIVTATEGQREVVKGPLVTADGLHRLITSDRGPTAFGALASPATGYYVSVGDAAGLSEAIRQLATDPAERRRLGDGGRSSAIETFTVERFAERIAEELAGGSEQARDALSIRVLP